MYSVISTAVINGIDGVPVSVEADISEGMPLFEMVGFLGAEVREAKERVRIALKNCGYHLPVKRITINILPAGVKKTGSGFDLPIAISLLFAMEVIKENDFSKWFFVGELGLDGTVHGVCGILPMVSGAYAAGKRIFVVPMENIVEASLIPDITVIGVETLKDTVLYLNEGIVPKQKAHKKNKQSRDDNIGDFSDINGQEFVKRACEVAASGMHNFLMVGPPGAGKTMIAKCMPSILPKMTKEEQLQLSKIYSICGLFGEREELLSNRPFRNPHHTISAAGLTGGGANYIRPGEISLASGGVLFLDELPEFRTDVLEILREPLEEKKVHITRAKGDYTFPASFQLIAAMNPCKCGYFPNFNKCTCTKQSVKNYLSKVSQPLLDRIDICVQIKEVPFKDISDSRKNESSESIRSRVERVHEIQKNRYINEVFSYNHQIPSKKIDTYCKLDESGFSFMEKMFEDASLTARTYHRILKVARTIADMEESEDIKLCHLQEAFLYRSMDKRYWEKVM